LFDVVDDAQGGIFRRPVVRRDSFGKDILTSPNSWPAPSIVDCIGGSGEILAAANTDGNDMEESIGDDLFQEGMGGTSNTGMSNPSHCRVAIPMKLVLE
jgi:hypothetical protein